MRDFLIAGISDKRMNSPVPVIRGERGTTEKGHYTVRKPKLKPRWKTAGGARRSVWHHHLSILNELHHWHFRYVVYIFLEAISHMNEPVKRDRMTQAPANTTRRMFFWEVVSYLGKQWAADRTQVSVMREPPQTWLPDFWKRKNTVESPLPHKQTLSQQVMVNKPDYIRCSTHLTTLRHS